MKYLYLLLVILFFSTQNANALFRNDRAQESVTPTAQPLPPTYHNTAAIYSPAPDRPPRRHINPDDRYRSTVEGTVSVVCALFSLLFFVAASAASFPLFIIPAMIFAVGATVFGAIGMKRHKRGFAILGLAAGLIEIVAGFFILAQL